MNSGGRREFFLNPEDYETFIRLPWPRVEPGTRSVTNMVAIREYGAYNHTCWRITFRFEDGDAEVVDYEDYH